MNKLMKCSDIRFNQLKREEVLDEKLKRCHCNSSINNYFYVYRSLNRKLMSDIYNTSIYNYPSKLIDNLDKIEEHLTKMESMVNICEEIPIIIENIKSELI